MKRTKLRKKKVVRKARLSNLFLAFAAIMLALLLNRLYLRYRPIPVTTVNDFQNSIGAIVVDETVLAQSSSVIYPNLTIPRLNLTLPIYPATVMSGKWQTTTKGLSRAQSSAPLGQVGNTVIYGHNWPNMLKNLPTLVPGDEIIVNLDADRTLAYITTYTATISPNDTSLTSPTKDVRLTLYTCVGPFDNQRFVVVAHPY